VSCSHERQWHLQYRDERRSAYADLLSLASQLPVAPDRVPERDADQLVDGFHRAASAAELHASPKAWVEMKPYVLLARLRANAISRGISHAQLQSESPSQGIGDPDKVDELRERYVNAARQDLRRSRGAPQHEQE